MLSLLALFLIALHSIVAFPECNNVQNVTTFPFAWPFDTLVPQPYNNLPNGCIQWQFAIPQAKYATVVVNAKFGLNDTFWIFNSVGYKQTYESDWSSSIPQNVSSTYFFPSDGLTRIVLVSKSSGLLSFRVDFHDVPDVTVIQSNVTSSFAEVTPLSKLATVEYRLNRQKGAPQMLISMASTGNYDVRADSCMIYTGPSCKDGKFAVGASFLIDNYYMSSDDDLAICCYSSNLPDFHLIITARPDFFSDDDSWFSRLSTDQTTPLDAISVQHGNPNASQYITTYCPGGCEEYLVRTERILTNFTRSLENITTMGIYAGMPSSGQWKNLWEMPLTQTDTWLPQQVLGSARTYVVRKGDAIITIIKNSTAWGKTSSTRQGFFMSANYPFANKMQNANTSISTNPNSVFVITNVDSNMGTDGQLFVATDTDVVTKFNKTATYTLQGSKITFTALSGAVPAPGAIAYFKIIPGVFSGSMSVTTTIAIGAAILMSLL